MSSTPILNPDLYTYILLDGERSPGVCRRTAGGDRTQQAQDQYGPGFDGGVTVMRFGEISKITYRFVVGYLNGTNNVNQDYRTLETWIEKLNRGAAQRPPKSYKFVDPWLRSQGIGTVAVISAGPIEQPEPGVQRFVAEVKWTEYRRMKPIGGAVSAKPQDAIDEAIATVQGMRDTAQKALDDALKASQAQYKTGRP